MGICPLAFFFCCFAKYACCAASCFSGSWLRVPRFFFFLCIHISVVAVVVVPALRQAAGICWLPQVECVITWSSLVVGYRRVAVSIHRKLIALSSFFFFFFRCFCLRGNRGPCSHPPSFNWDAGFASAIKVQNSALLHLLFVFWPVNDYLLLNGLTAELFPFPTSAIC